MLYKYFLTLTFIVSSLIPVSVFAQDQEVDLEAGETLFRNNCSSCHRTEGVLIGPGLGQANEKYADDREWLYKWVRNSQGLINQGDEKAVALYEEYNNQIMTAFPQLSDQDIDNILAWAEADANGTLPGQEPAQQNAAEGGAATNILEDPTIFYTLLALVGLLALIALVLVVITATLISAVKAKDGGQPLTFGQVRTQTVSLLQNKFVIAAIAIVALTGGVTKTIVEARKIGLHHGYMPEQPVKFSHKLHAGTHQIDCEYCHSGVRKSKSAWIPSVNVCMNCHKYIQEGPQYGTEEIAKVLAAWKDEEAIEWVRIHNVPDHAYFNHAQHVAVGGLECQTCHGPVEEMEVVYQYSDLGMGWCIDCHRQEKVKVLGKETDMTVADMGGLNCMRCHY